VPRPGSLIGGPGALHSVASAYAAVALVALTVVNAGRPSSTRQCHGCEGAAQRRRIAERWMGRHLVRAEIPERAWHPCGSRGLCRLPTGSFPAPFGGWEQHRHSRV